MGVAKKTRKYGQVKRIIGQRDARLKKNQDTGKKDEIKKKDDDVIREAYVLTATFYWHISNALQPSSLIRTHLPIQYSLSTAIPSPRGYQLPLSYRAEKAGNAVDYDGLSLRQMYSSDHGLCHG